MNLTVALPELKRPVATKIHCERKIMALPLSCLSLFVSTFTVILFSLLPLRLSFPNATFCAAFVSLFLPHSSSHIFFLFLCPSFLLISFAFVWTLSAALTSLSFFLIRLLSYTLYLAIPPDAHTDSHTSRPLPPCFPLSTCQQR